MRILSVSRCVLVGVLVSLFVSFCYADDRAVEVVGLGECADCKESNIKTSQAFSGLRVTVDCKTNEGHLKTRGVGELDRDGKFTVSLPNEILEDEKLKEECYAQLHSASLSPCPAHNGIESSKIVFQSKSNKKHTFSTAGKLTFSTPVCTSAFLWPHYFPKPTLPPFTPHPWKKYLPPLTKHPWKKYLPPLPPHPWKKSPVYKPPVYSHPPTPVYTHPPTPVYTHPPKPVYTHPPKPVYTHPPKPVYTHPPKPVYTHPPTPVYTHPPTPVYTHPPTPVYTHPPIYKKPLPPIYKKPCPPLIPLPKPPIIKKPCPPIIPLPKFPPKYFHHPKLKYFPPLPPHFPHHP